MSPNRNVQVGAASQDRDRTIGRHDVPADGTGLRIARQEFPGVRVSP